MVEKREAGKRSYIGRSGTKSADLLKIEMLE